MSSKNQLIAKTRELLVDLHQELVRYEYVERYKKISPCLLLHFDTEPFVRPIREHRFEEYEAFFKGMSIEIRST